MVYTSLLARGQVGCLTSATRLRVRPCDQRAPQRTPDQRVWQVVGVSKVVLRRASLWLLTSEHLSVGHSVHRGTPPASDTMEDAAEGFAEIEIVPARMDHLRACLSCSLVKTFDQFYETGCESEFVPCLLALLCDNCALPRECVAVECAPLAPPACVLDYSIHAIGLVDVLLFACFGER